MYKNFLFRSIILFTFFIAFSLSSIAQTLDSDNSCIASDDISQSLPHLVTSFGLYGIITSNFSMMSQNAEGEIPSSSSSTYKDGVTPIVRKSDGSVAPRCNAPTNNIKFCYLNQCTTLDPSSNATFTASDNTQFKAAFLSASKVCVQTLGSLGWVTMGCKYRFQPSDILLLDSSCYIGESCVNKARQHSKGFFPISSVIVECIRESVSKALISNEVCVNPDGSTRTNMLPAIQNALRNAVRAALILYVVLFGIRTAIGEDPLQSGETFIFIIKWLLVIYFSVGFYTGGAGNNSSSVINKTGNVVNTVNQYSDGINSLLVPGLLALSNSLSNIVFESGATNGICYYDPTKYAAGYSYLALWDSLDCRVAFYLGFADPKSGGAITWLASSLVSTILPGFFAYQIIYIIFIILFGVFFLSIAVFFVNIYVVSVIALGFMIYFAPLFVPMALFKATESYYHQWRNILLSFALQPLVIGAFLGLILVMYDQLYYGSCTFSSTSASLGNLTYPYFTINQSSDPSCTGSIGYMVSKYASNPTMIVKIPALLFEISILTPWYVMMILPNLVVIVIFSFLFYQFSSIIADFAADLTGGPSLGAMAIKPTAVADFISKLSKNAAIKKIANTFDKNEKTKNPRKNAGVNASGSDSGVRGLEKSHDNPGVKTISDKLDKGSGVSSSIKGGKNV